MMTAGFFPSGKAVQIPFYTELWIRYKAEVASSPKTKGLNQSRTC